MSHFFHKKRKLTKLLKLFHRKALFLPREVDPIVAEILGGENSNLPSSVSQHEITHAFLHTSSANTIPTLIPIPSPYTPWFLHSPKQPNGPLPFASLQILIQTFRTSQGEVQQCQDQLNTLFSGIFGSIVNTRACKDPFFHENFVFLQAQ